jgi:hypothetical protein
VAVVGAYDLDAGLELAGDLDPARQWPSAAATAKSWCSPIELICGEARSSPGSWAQGPGRSTPASSATA